MWTTKRNPFMLLAPLLLQILDTALAVSNCELPPSWHGSWFHHGFPRPLTVDAAGISHKGQCVQHRPHRHMYLMREGDEGDPFGTCYRCMMIYEKHRNVLQYKESYCEDSVDSMEALCATIAGDAPLYTMFRKDQAQLIKCPFRGPFEFTYSKGASGQTCSYPLSYMDSCENNTKVRLRYQACLDVKGSESKDESFYCLASWKEGSLRYLVGMMNHSHVHKDEERYRCFVFQRQQRSQGDNRTAGLTFKMAQSFQASCVGLWNVDEGSRTFTMKKLERPSQDRCTFPTAILHHPHGSDWESVSSEASPGLVSLHLNHKGHSAKLQERSEDGSIVEKHATCHGVKELGSSVRVIAHVKAGCDSGYVCLDFTRKDQNVFQLRHGAVSRHPDEACMSYYFSPRRSPLGTFIAANARSTIPCPFSGRFRLQPDSREHLENALAQFGLADNEGPGVQFPVQQSPLLASASAQQNEGGVCEDSLPSYFAPRLELEVGCSGLESFTLDTKCIDSRSELLQKQSPPRSRRRSSSPPGSRPAALQTPMQFQCNAEWAETEDDRGVGLRHEDPGIGGMYSSPTSVTAAASRLREVTAAEDGDRKVLLLSTQPRLRSDNSLGRSFICVTYSNLGNSLSLMSVSPCGQRSSSGSSSSQIGSYKVTDQTYLRDSAAVPRGGGGGGEGGEHLNMSSIGPCALGLSQGATSGSSPRSVGGLDVRLIALSGLTLLLLRSRYCCCCCVP